MKQILRISGGMLLAVLLAACGGGGGSPGATPGGTGGSGGTPATPMALELFSSSAQLSSSPNSTVSFTVVAKDAQNRAIPNQTVTFTASSGNLTGALPLPRTGPAGEPVTGVMLSPGGDRSNRDVTVTAAAGGIRQSLTIPVVGTQLRLSGSLSLLLGSTATYTVTARDQSGQAILGANLSASSAIGNSITPSNLVTDALGTAKFLYRANNAGLDTISVTGLGASARTDVAVSAEDFAFEAPAQNDSVPIGTNQTSTVRLLTNGAPAAGRVVTFSTTRGAVSPQSGVTDANGRVSTSISSTTAGPATITARSGTAQTILPVTYLATTPAFVVLQVNPAAVLPNTGGSSAHRAALQATVRDAAFNPVAGRIVNFTALSDLSNGSIQPGSHVTDENGIAEVLFVPGGLTTANDGVVIKATVAETTVSATTSLTVSGQALFISIGKGKLIGELSEPVYRKEFSVYVTDANGAPVPNQAVTLSVYPDLYLKGLIRLVRVDDVEKWVQGVEATCVNEDVDRNGILWPADEDFNRNGKLDPGLPVVISPSSVTTDSGGFGTFFLQYGKNFAMWLDATLTARAQVGGTESLQTQKYFLEVLAADFLDTATNPPNLRSPFGNAADCRNPN
jgi:hypothetical protein